MILLYSKHNQFYLVISNIYKHVSTCFFCIIEMDVFAGCRGQAHQGVPSIWLTVAALGPEKKRQLSAETQEKMHVYILTKVLIWKKRFKLVKIHEV